MNINEYRFAKNIVDLDKNINKAIEYIKENFNVESNYIEDDNKLELYIDNINESLNPKKCLQLAKKHIENILGDYILVNI